MKGLLTAIGFFMLNAAFGQVYVYPNIPGDFNLKPSFFTDKGLTEMWEISCDGNNTDTLYKVECRDSNTLIEYPFFSSNKSRLWYYYFEGDRLTSCFEIDGYDTSREYFFYKNGRVESQYFSGGELYTTAVYEFTNDTLKRRTQRQFDGKLLNTTLYNSNNSIMFASADSVLLAWADASIQLFSKWTDFKGDKIFSIYGSSFKMSTSLDKSRVFLTAFDTNHQLPQTKFIYNIRKNEIHRHCFMYK